MKFKDYVEGLNELLKNNPEAGDYEAVTSRDDEGNQFNKIHYEPNIGFYSEEDKEFDAHEGVDTVNSVCVN